MAFVTCVCFSFPVAPLLVGDGVRVLPWVFFSTCNVVSPGAWAYSLQLLLSGEPVL